MRISKFVYGFMIVGILLGGLIITNIAGVWNFKDRSNSGGRHAMSTDHSIVSVIHKTFVNNIG